MGNGGRCEIQDGKQQVLRVNYLAFRSSALN